MAGLPYPHPTSEAVTRRMRSNPSVDTKPEQAVRSALHRRCLRFRKNLKIDTPIRSVRPDIVFPRHRLAVFIDGCFWHRCPQHGTSPKLNSAYWAPKLDRNVRRDREVDSALSRAGWTVLRAWEHEPADDVAKRVAQALNDLS